MPEQNNNTHDNYGQIYFQWQMPEYNQHDRGFYWYLIMVVLALGLLVWCYFTKNLFFAIIIILAVYIVFLRHYYEPKQINFLITDDGILLGRDFIPYSKIKKFYIIYQPPAVKKLYFDLKGLVSNVSIPLDDQNPVLIRQKLLEFLSEDLDKEGPTLSDSLDTLLKL